MSTEGFYQPPPLPLERIRHAPTLVRFADGDCHVQDSLQPTVQLLQSVVGPEHHVVRVMTDLAEANLSAATRSAREQRRRLQEAELASRYCRILHLVHNPFHLYSWVASVTSLLGSQVWNADFAKEQGGHGSPVLEDQLSLSYGIGLVSLQGTLPSCFCPVLKMPNAVAVTDCKGRLNKIKRRTAAQPGFWKP